MAPSPKHVRIVSPWDSDELGWLSFGFWARGLRVSGEGLSSGIQLRDLTVIR